MVKMKTILKPKRENIPIYILRLIVAISTAVYVCYAALARGDMTYTAKLKAATEIYSACLLEGIFFFVMADITRVFD